MLADLAARAGSTACSSTCTARWCRRAWTTARATSSRPCAAAVGPSVPIAVTLDFHGNLAAGHGRGRRSPATATRPTRTWTWPSAAWRPARGSPRSSPGASSPTAALRKPPLLPPLGNQGTARGPMRRLYDLADEMEKDPEGHLDLDLRGLPATRTSPTRASASTSSRTTTRPWPSALAEQLARMAWEHRHEFIHTALPVHDAVAKALAADGRPIVLADMADNTGGGAAGDGTEILRELVRVGARSAVVACLWDPARGGRLREGGRGRRDHARRRRQGRRPPRGAPRA